MLLDLFVYSLEIEKLRVRKLRVKSKDEHPGVRGGAAGTLLKESHVVLRMFPPRGRDCLC